MEDTQQTVRVNFKMVCIESEGEFKSNTSNVEHADFDEDDRNLIINKLQNQVVLLLNNLQRNFWI